MGTKDPIIEQFEKAFADEARRDNRCRVQVAIDEHPAGAVIKAKVDDVETYNAAQIAKVLKALGVKVEGFPLSNDSISRHRSGNCRCVAGR